MIEQTVTARRCKCGRANLVTDFYAQKNGKGGHKSECKLCTRECVAKRAKVKRADTAPKQSPTAWLLPADPRCFMQKLIAATQHKHRKAYAVIPAASGPSFSMGAAA